MSLGEFDIIETYFLKEKKRNDVILGIGDDCAILQPPTGKYLLVSTDTLNVNSHFFPNTLPFDIGYKAVAVSLSDLAAMGGEPAWLLLSLTLPNVNEAWLESFSKGLFTCLNSFNVSLVGGNTSKGPLAITTQIIGFGDDTALTRHSAQKGDYIFVTGTLGDAGLSLAFLKNELCLDSFTKEEIESLKSRLFRPIPRIQEGQMIKNIAHAAIDISDGLLADLQQILNASQVGATIWLEKVPLSNLVRKIPDPLKTKLALTSGDDYELCFTLPPQNLPFLTEIITKISCPLHCIGQVEEESGLWVKDIKGEVISIGKFGYTHF